MATSDILRSLVTQVRVDTAYLPPIVIEDPFKPGQGPPSPVLQALKPRITLMVSGRPVVVAPYGDPGPSKWPAIKTGLAIAGGIGLVLLLKRLL